MVIYIGSASTSSTVNDLEKQLEEFLEKTAQAASDEATKQSQNNNSESQVHSHSDSNHSATDSGSESNHSGHSSHSRSPSTDKESKRPTGGMWLLLTLQSMFVYLNDVLLSSCTLNVSLCTESMLCFTFG